MNHQNKNECCFIHKWIHFWGDFYSSKLDSFLNTYRKVASSRPVYYLICEHFWGATNWRLLYRRATIQFLHFFGVLLTETCCCLRLYGMLFFLSCKQFHYYKSTIFTKKMAKGLELKWILENSWYLEFVTAFNSIIFAALL